MINDWGLKDLPKPNVIMQASEDLRELIDNNHDDPLMEVVNWLWSVADRGMPGTKPDSINHRVGRSNTPTPLDKRPTKFYYHRTDTFNMTLEQEFGNNQIRTRVYAVKDAGYVATKTIYDAWGNHNYDELVPASGGPVISKEKALELAKNLLKRLEEHNVSRCNGNGD